MCFGAGVYISSDLHNIPQGKKGSRRVFQGWITPKRGRTEALARLLVYATEPNYNSGQTGMENTRIERRVKVQKR